MSKSRYDPSGLSDRADIASQLVDLFRQFLIDRLSDITWREFVIDPILVVEKVCAIRQHEALRATLLLHQSSLGHLAVGYVRPACEEYIWLAYLNSVDKDRARILISSLALEESTRSIAAQRRHMGADGMVALGFPDKFLTETETQGRIARTQLKALGAELGWPPDSKGRQRGRLPSSDWVADQVGQKRLYDYLHSASSRMLHFSVSEITRRGWGATGADQVLRFDDPDYVAYRTDFALSWQVYFLTQTAGVLRMAAGPIMNETEGRVVADAVERFGALGPVPIIRPEEMNLTQEPSQPSQ
jgi:hypothetical protein